jgi:hypothetical protein
VGFLLLFREEAKKVITECIPLAVKSELKLVNDFVEEYNRSLQKDNGNVFSSISASTSSKSDNDSTPKKTTKKSRTSSASPKPDKKDKKGGKLVKDDKKDDGNEEENINYSNDLFDYSLLPYYLQPESQLKPSTRASLLLDLIERFLLCLVFN